MELWLGESGFGESGLTDFGEVEIRLFAERFETLFYERDAAAMASYYWDDARIMADDADVSGGCGAIEAFWHEACAHEAIQERTIEVKKIESVEGMGYVLSVVTLRVQLPQRPIHIVKINDVTIWRRGSHGRWKIALDFASRGEAAPR
jgi:ketosteroid isomerase-like protein